MWLPRLKTGHIFVISSIFSGWTSPYHAWSSCLLHSFWASTETPKIYRCLSRERLSHLHPCPGDGSVNGSQSCPMCICLSVSPQTVVDMERPRTNWSTKLIAFKRVRMWFQPPDEHVSLWVLPLRLNTLHIHNVDEANCLSTKCVVRALHCRHL